VARRVDRGERVENDGPLRGIALVSRDAVSVNEVLERLEGQRLDDPGVVSADKIMGPAVRADVALPAVRMLGVRHRVAVRAGDVSGVREGRSLAAEGSPVSAADRAGHDAVGKARARRGDDAPEPGVILGQPEIGLADDGVGGLLRPGEAADIFAGPIDVGRGDEDRGMNLRALDLERDNIMIRACRDAWHFAPVKG
jgi:hypothetical protein